MPSRKFGTTARVLVGAALVTAILAAAACSSGGTTGKPAAGGRTGGTGSTIAAAIDRFGEPATGPVYLEFGDMAGQRELAGGDPRGGTFTGIAGFGASIVAETPYPVIDKTGVDPFAATTAVTVDLPPKGVTVLDGSFDARAIGIKLAALGYHPVDRGSGQTDWVIRDNRQVDTNDTGPLAHMGLGDDLNVVRVSASRIAYGGATADIDAVLGKSTPVSADATVAALAQCLGSPAAAAIAVGTAAPLPLGVGVVATSAADAQEVLCVAASDDNAAKALAAAWPQRIQTANQISGEPFSKVLSAPGAALLGGPAHVVRLTAHATHIGYLLGELAEGGINPLLGVSAF
jgi:hypothetical protein